MKAVFGCSLATGMVSWLCGWEGLLACVVLLGLCFGAASILDRFERDMGKGGEF